MDKQKQITAAEITEEVIANLHNPWEEMVEKANKAAQAYLKDVDDRKAALEKQAQGYQAHLGKLEAQRKTLISQINDLSSRGQIDAAAEVDAKLEVVDGQIAALRRKIRLVNSADLRGDADLYNAVKDAYDAVIEEGARCKNQLRELMEIANNERKRLTGVIDSMSSFLQYRNYGQPIYSAFNKVDRHFRDLDRIEREEREKAAAEHAAAAKRPFIQCSVPPSLKL